MTHLKESHIHLISDATGETVLQIFQACTTYFKGVEFHEHVWSLIRTKTHLEKVLQRVKEQPGIVFFTTSDPEKKLLIEEECEKLNVPTFNLLEHPVSVISEYLGVETVDFPKTKRKLDEAYFRRIDAMDFTMRHDDGQINDDLDQADIILVGVSRTSKSPTCIYLANKGYKAANIPYVMECPLPQQLLEMDSSDLKNPLIVGLHQDVQLLVKIRTNRLRMLNSDSNTSYTDLDLVKKEVNQARRFYSERKWPIIDVTGRSIEETSAAVLQIYQKTGRERH